MIKRGLSLSSERGAEDSDSRGGLHRISKRPQGLIDNKTDPIDQHLPKTVTPMESKQPRLQVPEVQFRVLIIGRANAGKTSILQRVCETTESPVIYRRRQDSDSKPEEAEMVRDPINSS